MTDQQVRLLRQKRMEGKTQQTAAAMTGISERAVRRWECGPLPSETKQGRWKSAVMVICYTRAEGAGAALQWMGGGR